MKTKVGRPSAGSKGSVETKVGRPSAESKGTVEIRGAAGPGAMEKIVLTLPCGLVDRVTEAAERKGLTRMAYIRMVLTENLANDSMEEVDRQLYELAKRTEQGPRARG